jgi:hypothetical protein
MRNKLWNTGVDDQGIPLAPKNVDPHWELIQGPGVTPSNPQKVYVLGNQKAGNYFATPDSMWIWANPSGKGDTTQVYIFQTKFYIEVDFSQYWFQINGKWGTDNFGQFTIDRLPLPPGSGGGVISLPPGNVVANYQQTHNFSISQAHPFSLSHLHLNEGWHTLEVLVYNEGAAGDDDPNVNPAGLNLSALSIDLHSLPHIPSVPHH